MCRDQAVQLLRRIAAWHTWVVILRWEKILPWTHRFPYVKLLCFPWWRWTGTCVCFACVLFLHFLLTCCSQRRKLPADFTLLMERILWKDRSLVHRCGHTIPVSCVFGNEMLEECVFYFRLICLSVRLSHETTREPLNRFSWKFVFDIVVSVEGK